jgi:hypothetical protein
MVPEARLELARQFDPSQDFLTTSTFAAAAALSLSQRLWSGLCLHRSLCDVRCPPSSLYTFLGSFHFQGLARRCQAQGSPTLKGSTPTVSGGALDLEAMASRQVLCVYQFRHSGLLPGSHRK